MRDETIGVVTDNSFSVDKEFKTIFDNEAANKNYFVVISDSEKLKIDKKDIQKHKVKIVSSFQIEDLRKRLLNLEMQDGGIQIQGKRKPEPHPIWLYIIDKG